VPLESVVDALRHIHSAVVPGGLVLDMQPIGPRPPVEVDGRALGSLDMREWRGTVNAVTALVDQTLSDGLFREEGRRDYDVLETFDDGRELVETVREWDGTKISRTLAARVERAAPPVVIREPVRMRVLRVL
jgi:hypothetical protein